jgi:high-affinity Fe2+/Pb2+ permease
MMTLGLVNITLMHAVATKRWLPMAMAGLGIGVLIGALFIDASVKEVVQSTEMVMGATAVTATITEGIMEWFGSTSAQSR